MAVAGEAGGVKLRDLRATLGWVGGNSELRIPNSGLFTPPSFLIPNTGAAAL